MLATILDIPYVAWARNSSSRTAGPSRWNASWTMAMTRWKPCSGPWLRWSRRSTTMGAVFQGQTEGQESRYPGVGPDYWGWMRPTWG